MKRVALILLLSLAASAAPSTVTYRGKSVPVSSALKAIASASQGWVLLPYGRSGTDQMRVSANWNKLPADQAVEELRSQFGKTWALNLIDKSLVIRRAEEEVPPLELFSLPKGIAQPGGVFYYREFLLENKPAPDAIRLLQSLRKDVHFVNHPKMNGFYAAGSREAMKAVWDALPNLDR